MREESVIERLDLQAACEKLTRRQQVALQLWLMGYSQPEIGRQLGIKKAAVCRLVKRGTQTVAALAA